MLAVIKTPSLDALIDEIVPRAIRLAEPMSLPPALTEHEYLGALRAIAAKNRVVKSLIGLGYNDTITPPVILRNVFENPGWYTPYTPYQAEIAQGRLESLLNFQTMVRDLTGMDVANASLLDEPTAAGEAMTLLHRVQSKRAGVRNTFLVSSRTWPQTRAVLQSRAEPLGIAVREVPPDAIEFGADAFGLLIQYPDEFGQVDDLSALIARAHDAGVLVAVATDLLALTLLTPPGESGADVVVGNSQRFGVPLGYGGPHAAFFATRDAYVRQVPGRVIGVSVDSSGRPAYRMALQTREQHIRREKATSNICTAQALLANMAAMYAVYHGPEGLRAIAARVHALAHALAASVARAGYRQRNTQFFDTLHLDTPGRASAVVARALEAGFNLRQVDADGVVVALDETVTAADIAALSRVFAEAAGVTATPIVEAPAPAFPPALARRTPFLTHPVFNAHHSETEMMRYIRSLERKDIGLGESMIPLGSCTMKLNAAAEMLPVTWAEFSRLHPFAPAEQAQGYAQIFAELEHALCVATGFAAVSLQPNSGAQGELAGLLVIRAWHQSRGQAHRNVVLIPSSAHGTNPASAVMAGMHVVVVATDGRGYVDVADLRAKAEEHRDDLSALMVTYPSTHGVYQETIREICAVVHEHGGQVYMDGANMNAQVGLTSPASIGADVCHLNLHKTFAIPHGGGGPGMGPIGVAAAPGAVSAGPSAGQGRRREGDCAGRGRAMGQREHPAHLLRLRPDAGRRRHDQRDADRDAQRQLHQVAPRGALRRALHQRGGSRGARDDLRPAGLQERRRRGDRRRQAADGLRLPRADGLVPGAGHPDDRADGERAKSGARPVLRRDDRDSRRDFGGRERQGRSQGQRAEERAPHRRHGHRRRVEPSVLAAPGRVSAAVGLRQQALAGRRPDRQPVRRPQSLLRLPADRGVLDGRLSQRPTSTFTATENPPRSDSSKSAEMPGAPSASGTAA